MDSRRLIASSCRQKILQTLSKVEETYLMDLVRRTNSTYTQVSRNVEILEKEGVIKVRSVGRFRMIQLDHENPKTDALLKALKLLRNADAMQIQSSKESASLGRQQKTDTQNE
jgi:DNA-binding MarR family transcriptional regulator